MHVVKKTKEQIEGSPARALNIDPLFDRFYFIDMNKDKAAHLEKLCEGRSNVEIHAGDTNPYLKKLLPTIRYTEYKRALCLLDPYGLQLDWEVMRLAGQAKKVDMFLNFPIMDMNRNAIWREPDKASPQDIARMNRFWGDESWKQVAYAPSRQQEMFSEPETEKQSNDVIVAAFRERLKTVAGFEYVPEPLPMRNKNNAVVYYLFFASAKPVAANIIKSIFKSSGKT